MSTKNNYLLLLAAIGIFVTVLIFVTGKKMFAPSKGAWFIAYPQGTDDMRNISDEPYEFKLDNMSCGATKTHFARGQMVPELKQENCIVGHQKIHTSLHL